MEWLQLAGMATGDTTIYHNTSKSYHFGGVSHLSAPFSMILASSHYDASRVQVSASPLVYELTVTRELLAYDELSFRFTPTGDLEVTSRSNGVLAGTRASPPPGEGSALQHVTFGPYTALGVHKSQVRPLVTVETAYIDTSVDSGVATLADPMPALTDVAAVNYGAGAPGFPITYPDARIGVVYPPVWPKTISGEP